MHVCFEGLRSTINTGTWFPAYLLTVEVEAPNLTPSIISWSGRYGREMFTL
jgi:hypothetical protein